MSASNTESEFLRPSSNRDATKRGRLGMLAVSGISGFLASACCIGPLAFASLGLGGLAAGMVAVFDPLRPVFLVIAFAALGFAGWTIYRRPVDACETGVACARPYTDRRYKTVFWISTLIVFALITFPYYVVFLY